MMRVWARAAAVFTVILTAGCGGGEKPRVEGSGAGSVQVQDFHVDGKDDGVTLFIRNKRPAEWVQPRPERTVLFLHGATFPGHATFDLPIEGTSWMDWMARRGYDVYALDIRGFGKSSRPAAMNEPADKNPPLVDTEQALRDVSKAVDFILSRTGQPRLVLVGWSWGATLAGRHAETAGNQIDRLVLLSPQWLRDGIAPDAAALPAWRSVKIEQARDLWFREVPAAERKELASAATLAAWTEAMKQGNATEELRVPNGAAADILRASAVGTPPWKPEKVSVPTLVIQGEWDVDWPPAMGAAVFARLTQAPQKRYVLIGEATHSMMLEKNRGQLYRTVQGFLEEGF